MKYLWRTIVNTVVRSIVRKVLRFIGL